MVGGAAGWMESAAVDWAEPACVEAGCFGASAGAAVEG